MRHHIIFAVLFSFMTLCGTTQAGVEPSCPSGFSLKNGVCAGAPNICPAGTSFKDGLCSGMPGCPVGSSTDNGYCAVVPNCAAGYTYNKNVSACTTNPTCPTDFKYSAELGRCRSCLRPVFQAQFKNGVNQCLVERFPGKLVPAEVEGFVTHSPMMGSNCT